MISESSSDFIREIDLTGLRSAFQDPIKFLCAVEILFESNLQDIYDEQMQGVRNDFRENMKTFKRLFDDYLQVKEEQEKVEEENMEITCRICSKKFKVENLKAHSTLCLERINLLKEFHSTNEKLQKIFEDVTNKKSEMIRSASKLARTEKKRDWSTDLSDEHSQKGDGRRHSTLTTSTFNDSPALQKSFFFKIKENTGPKRNVDLSAKPRISNSEDLLPLAENLTEERSETDDDKKVFTDPSMTTSQVSENEENKKPPLRRSSNKAHDLLYKESGFKQSQISPSNKFKSNTSSAGNFKKPLPNIEFKERELKRGAKILDEILKYGEKISHEQGDYNLSRLIFSNLS